LVVTAAISVGESGAIWHEQSSWLLFFLTRLMPALFLRARRTIRIISMCRAHFG
jgi:hypothetical protein